MTKRYIYRCKLNDKLPIHQAFGYYLRKVAIIEHVIADKKRLLQVWNNQWEEVLEMLYNTI